MIHRALALVLCAMGALLVACGGSEPPPPVAAPPPQVVDNYSGHWRGLVQVTSTIPNAPQQMDVSATITANNPGQCGSFEYGAIACSGAWNCVSGFGDAVMQIQETIRFGQERCPNGAQVELRTTADSRQLEFHYTSSAIQAHGTLQRGDLQ